MEIGTARSAEVQKTKEAIQEVGTKKRVWTSYLLMFSSALLIAATLLFHYFHDTRIYLVFEIVSAFFATLIFFVFIHQQFQYYLGILSKPANELSQKLNGEKKS